MRCEPITAEDQAYAPLADVLNEVLLRAETGNTPVLTTHRKCCSWSQLAELALFRGPALRCETGRALDRAKRLDAIYLIACAQLESVGDESLPPEELRTLLLAALAQAAEGKGRDRHVDFDTQDFLNQDMFSIAEILDDGTGLGHLFQAIKKLREADRILIAKNGPARALTERLGAIVYIAASVIQIEIHGIPSAS